MKFENKSLNLGSILLRVSEVIIPTPQFLRNNNFLSAAYNHDSVEVDKNVSKNSGA